MSSPSSPSRSVCFSKGFPVLYWLLLISMMLLPAGVGAWAVVLLLNLPELPICQGSFQAGMDAGDRLYCAEMKASEASPEDLLEAIRLVSSIPVEDPLRSTGDRLVRRWVQQLIQLAEATFQQGNPEEAIDILHRIPLTAQRESAISQKIEQWQTLWDEAEQLYQDGEAAIAKENWYDVLRIARQLLVIKNQYWATVRYRELIAEMQSMRESKQQTQQMARALRNNGTQDWLQQWEREQEQENVKYLKQAQELANGGTVAGLSAGIEVAYQVLYGSPQYDQAQQLITNWQQQIETLEDRPYLERAIALAAKGEPHALEAAIEEAERIQWGRVLYDDANAHIEQWKAQLQTAHQEMQQQQLEQLSDTELSGSERTTTDGAAPNREIEPQERDRTSGTVPSPTWRPEAW